MALFGRNKDDKPQQPYAAPPIAEQRRAADAAAAPEAPAAAGSPAQQVPQGVSQAPVDQFTIRPLSVDGLRRAADNEGWKYQVTQDGKMIGLWDNNNFMFVPTGASDEYLQVQSQWKGVVPAGAVEQVRSMIDAWHRDKLWPTISMTPADGGGFHVNTTLTVDYEYGVTDAQILLQMRCALATSLQVYGELDKMFGQSEGQ